jgi:hypothetical protein
MKHLPLVLVYLLLSAAAFSQRPQTTRVPLSSTARAAVELSKLTLPGSRPFHIKIRIFETNSPDSDMRATVEEYWVSPQKWRRVIKSEDFSQTLVVNDDRILEEDEDDYSPWWLNDLLTAVFDPLPMLDSLEKTDVMLTVPVGPGRGHSCADFHTPIDRSVFCFDVVRKQIDYVVARGYSAVFKDYRAFGPKMVARNIEIDPEPGTNVQARVEVLEEFAPDDEHLFEVKQSTPEEKRITRVLVGEEQVRKLMLGDPEIHWPPVGGGPTTGRCGLFISIDRSGQAREVWPNGCDNAGVGDSLREQVRKWKFRPALVEGRPVQVETLLTFTFHTTLVPKK